MIVNHAASVFEAFCRSQIPEAQRFWENDVELDLVGPDPQNPGGILAAEVKWRRLSAAEREKTLKHLQMEWTRSSLNSKYPKVRFDVFDASHVLAL